jgi:methionyl-tRNA formyltransferase
VRVLFLGTPSFAVPTLEALLEGDHEVLAVLTRPDRPRGRGGRLAPSPVKLAALRHGLPVLQPRQVNGERALAAVRALAPDVAVIVAFGRILSPDFLSLPARGCVNLHGSLLPAYRGAAPIQWAVARGETRTGLTTMRLDAGLDTGDILLQRGVEIGDDENAADLADRMARLGAPLVVETLDGLARGSVIPRPQPREGVSRAPLLRREDGRIDWRRDAPAIALQVRGMQPWPVAHARRGEAWLRLFRASPAGPAPAGEAPGTVVGPRGDAALVVCGGGTLLALREVQPDSRRRMSGREALNGRVLRPGDVLE